ncbi:MAG: hypothetical protein JJE35_14240 [Thermoleophilia bacterium]|nr:hypothetical protein [Thermoleophilia bacterium]
MLPKAIREALADGKTGTVRVTVTVIDAAGEETTRTIRVKIKQKGGG